MPTNQRFTKQISRREFLIASSVGGAALATLAAGCGRRKAVSSLPPVSGAPAASSALYKNAPTPAPTGEPDLILRNGKLLTIDSSNSVAQAMAVKDGLIQAVGEDAAIDALKAPTTQVIDLNGRVLTPGLIDPHLHLAVVGMMNEWVSFEPPDADSTEEVVAKIKEIASQTPKGEWIQCYFLIITDDQVPDRYALDKATSEHPVYLTHRGGHFGAANSLALQLAGINKDTQSPMGSTIEKDKQGEPTGRFYNHRAMYLVLKAAPPRPPENIRNGIIADQMLLASAGMTTFQDVYVFNTEVYKAYAEIGKANQMRIRGAVYPVLENPGNIDYIEKLEHVGSDYMRLAGFKLQIDGQVPTAFCHEATKGIKWDMPAWEPKIYKETVRRLHDLGLPIAVHCMGDAAVDLTLDAFEEAMNANPRPDPRHRIEHCLLNTPQATQRMKDLGVVVSYSSSFIKQAGDAYIYNFGEKRCIEELQPARAWLEAGLPVALNSDYPTTLWHQPQVNMATAMQRASLKGTLVAPDQRLSFMEALRAHTLGGAYACYEEHLKGSLVPGKWADLAVWTKDPTGMTPEELELATIDLTYVGGKQVFPA